MFQYVLFDLDGTLTDPKIGITTCVQYGLKSLGIEENNLDKLEPFIGPPLLDSFMEFYGLSKEEAEQATEKYRERFSTVGLYENEIYPGVKEMLTELKRQGVHLAVASSKPTVFVEKILKHFSIFEYFEVIVGSELDGRRTDKQEVVDEALRQLQVTEEKKIFCAMVGDRKFDIQGAKAHGVTAVGVAYGYAAEGELETAQADFIAESVNGLYAYLLNQKAENEKNRKKFAPFTSLFPRVTQTPPPESTSFMRAFSVITPILIYYIVNNLVIFGMAYLVQWFAAGDHAFLTISRLLAENSTLVSALSKFFAMGVGILVLMPALWQEHPVLSVKSIPKKDFAVIGILGVSAALFVNVAFSLLHFTGSSRAYGEVAQSQFALPIWGGILLYGLISPIAEEVVFRGIVYNRLRRQFPFMVAFLGSGILFGVYHGNMVQALYGFLLGLLITWLYERYGSFLIPVFVHAMANISVYIVMGIIPLKAVVMTPVCCMFMGIITVILIVYLSIKKQIKYKE